jgi:pimeloyl-ACP methyl ester carboxylesterase
VECEIAGLPVHYVEHGTGRPVLLLHGWTLDHSEMVFEMESHFTDRTGWRRIYLDLPGFGRTPGSDRITGSDEVLKVVLDFLAKVIPGERFVAVGTSYGAYIARGLVRRCGSDMDGLLLNVPVVHADEAKRTVPPRSVIVRDEAFVKGARDEGLGWVEELGVVLDPSLHAYAKALGGIAPGDVAFQEKVRARYAFSFDVDRLEQPFPAPTLMLMGRQDNVVGYVDAWKLVANFPRATFVVLDRAGHLLWGEQAGLASALTSEWLDRVEEWTVQRRATTPG